MQDDNNAAKMRANRVRTESYSLMYISKGLVKKVFHKENSFFVRLIRIHISFTFQIGPKLG